MRKHTLLILFSLTLSTLFAQKLTDKIVVDNFESTFFKHILLEKINDIRDSLEQEKLIINNDLSESADFHAKFVSKDGKMTHYQSKKKYKDARIRATTFGIEKKFVWENMLSCAVLKPTYISYKRGNKKTTITTYKELLDFMINGFIALPANLTNIKSPKVHETGIGVFFNKKTNHFYLVQVFSD